MTTKSAINEKIITLVQDWKVVSRQMDLEIAVELEIRADSREYVIEFKKEGRISTYAIEMDKLKNMSMQQLANESTIKVYKLLNETNTKPTLTKDKAIELIKEYYMKEFEQVKESNFNNLSCIPLAYTFDYDIDSEIQVDLNLTERILITTTCISKEETNEYKFESDVELLDFLETMEFDMLVVIELILNKKE